MGGDLQTAAGTRAGGSIWLATALLGETGVVAWWPIIGFVVAVVAIAAVRHIGRVDDAAEGWPEFSRPSSAHISPARPTGLADLARTRTVLDERRLVDRLVEA